MGKNSLCYVFLAIFLAGSARAGTIYYVDQNATDPPDGMSWCSAYDNLHFPLLLAGPGDEVRVAHGVYKPDDCQGFCSPSDPARETSFKLTRDNVAIKGGYWGCGATSPNARGLTTTLGR